MAQHYERGSAINMATKLEIDAVIDPAQTRACLLRGVQTQPDHRQRALDCALEMDVFAVGYAQSLQSRGVNWGVTRIGVHCGEVIVGNFGGKTLFD